MLGPHTVVSPGASTSCAIPSHWCVTGVTDLGFQVAGGWGHLLDYFFFRTCGLNVGFFF